MLTDDLPTTGGGSVAFGRNPNTLYLGLGDPFDQILVGGAMTKSTNGGVELESDLIELGTAVSVRDVKVDTSTNRDIVLVATDNGLYRSADEGDTYSEIATFAGHVGLEHGAHQRRMAGVGSTLPAPRLWAACADRRRRCISRPIAAPRGHRSRTWKRLLSLNGRTTLGVASAGDAVVYAYSSTRTTAQMRDVYRSSNGGQTWVANNVNSTKIPTNPVPPSSMPNMNICHGQCWYNQMVLVDPTDPSRNTVWIGGDLATARTATAVPRGRSKRGGFTARCRRFATRMPTITPRPTRRPARPRSSSAMTAVCTSAPTTARLQQREEQRPGDAPLLHGRGKLLKSQTS